MKPADTKVWVISLRDAALRRDDFRRAVGKSSEGWEFWDAHTGLIDGLTYDADNVPGNYGRSLQPAEIGCYASHFSLWQWLLESEAEQMIVLEDDVVADWEFIAELQRRDFSRMGISYLRLFAKMPSPWRFVASPCLEKYRHLIRYTGYALGTQAYLLTKTGARMLVERGRRIEAPVDVYMDRTWDHRVLNLAIYPFPVYERFRKSSIGEARFEEHRLSLRGTFIRNFLKKVRRRALFLWSVYGTDPLSLRRTRKHLVAGYEN